MTMREDGAFGETRQKRSEAADVLARLAADPNAQLMKREAEVTFIGDPADDAACQ